MVTCIVCDTDIPEDPFTGEILDVDYCRQCATNLRDRAQAKADQYDAVVVKYETRFGANANSPKDPAR